MSVVSADSNLLNHDQYERLSPSHQRLANYVAQNPSSAAFESASEIARRMDMSTATVVRFAQALGFSGYPEFQSTVRQNYLSTLEPLDSVHGFPSQERDFFELQLYQDLENLRRTIHTLHLNRSRLIELAGRIQQAREIAILASSGDTAIASTFGHALRLMGYRASVEVRGGSYLIQAVYPLGKGDLALGFCFGPARQEATRALAWASERRVVTAALTDTAYSPISRVVDLSIALPTEGVSFFRSLVAPLAIVQGLIIHIAQSRGEQGLTRLEEAMRFAETDESR